MDETVLDDDAAAFDERQHVRFEGRVPCHLIVDDQVWNAWIRDLSAGGAGLEPAMPATLGRKVLLASPGFDFEAPLTGRVVNVADRRTCVEFALEAEVEAELIRFIEQNT